MCTCVSVGLPCVYMCVGRSALCVHVCRSVCLLCTCVGQSAFCVHVCWSVCLLCTCVLVGLPCVCMCVGRSALCVGVDCANFVNLYEIKFNQIVVIPLHGAGENVISYLVQPH